MTADDFMQVAAQTERAGRSRPRSLVLRHWSVE
jgi:hypothetical protein